MTDKIKLLIAVLLVVAGIGGFYMLADAPVVVRVLSVLAGLALGAVVAAFTDAGRAVLALAQDSWVEARKVVWPTRQETLQMVAVVVVFVLVMGLFLWLVDSLLFGLTKWLMGGAG
jgi:preprotein translocase subunit SecE